MSTICRYVSGPSPSRPRTAKRARKGFTPGVVVLGAADARAPPDHPLQPLVGPSGARFAVRRTSPRAAWLGRYSPGIPTRTTHPVPIPARTPLLPHRTLRCSHGWYSRFGHRVGEPRGMRTHVNSAPRTLILRFWVLN